MSGQSDYVKTMEVIHEKLAEITSERDILIFFKDMWKHMVPSSNIDKLLDILLLEDDFDVGEMIYMIEQFFKSNSQDFLKFLKEHFKIVLNKNTEL